MPSTPKDQEFSKAGKEFSGRLKDTPRCAIIIKSFYRKSNKSLSQLE
jgi:hypothetical protein